MESVSGMRAREFKRQRKLLITSKSDSPPWRCRSTAPLASMNRSAPRVDKSPPRLHRAVSLPVSSGRESRNSSSSSHVRVIVRIRPLNQEEAKSSRVCLHAEKAEPSQAPPNRSGSVVGSLLGRLATATSTTLTPSRSHEDKVEDVGYLVDVNNHDEELDQGMILSDQRLTPPSRLLSPHYTSSPMRTVHNSKTVVVETHQSQSAAPRRFTVDQVFPPTATQQDVYGSVGDVRAVFRGYNVTILAYGQTSSGKTYTMMGRDQDGVIPLAIHDLFSQEQQYVSVQLSCMEIYQDELKDLLAEASCSTKQHQPDLKLRDATKGTGVQVRGLSAVKVDSAAQVLALLSSAQDRRRTGSTRLNERSSRSHMITSITVKNASVNPSVTAKLTLVDLAGSERIKQTEVVGAALGESIHINTDLFTLGKVVNALCEKSPHVPYRDSKLTRLLKDALGGNCSTTLICCVSPSELYLEESINTLRYAERSRSITNSLEQNVVAKTATPFEVAELRAENKRLRSQILQFQKQLKGTGLQSLLDKLQKAHELGCEVRENSQLVSQQADKLRDQVQRFQPESKISSSTESSSLLEYELSLVGDDEDSLVDASDEESLLSMDTTTKAKSLAVEVKALTKEKDALKDILLDTSNQIEARREDLEQLEDDIEQQTKLRNDLAVEVSQMKQRLHLLATGETESATGLLGLLRRSSKNEATSGVEVSELEMRTMKVKDTESMTLAKELAKSLGEERTRGEELETKCKELQLQVEQTRSLSEALSIRNQKLQDEVNRLRGQLDGKVTPATASPTSSDDTPGLENQYGEEEEGMDATEPHESQRCESSEREGPHNERVKFKVREILRLAGDGPGIGSSGTCGSMVSSLGTELLPGADEENDSPDSTNNLGKFFISNIHDANKCTCEASMFSTNAEHVDFYLPLLGVSCTCGKQPRVVAANNPFSLESILRPWQVEFLNSVGIGGAVEFVHAFTQRGVLLATEMRKWRRQKGMLSVKTKSCRVALHIWHRTCKSVIRHVREQQAHGATELHRPDFLEIAVSDHTTVSTLGGGSAYNKQSLNVSTVSF